MSAEVLREQIRAQVRQAVQRRLAPAAAEPVAAPRRAVVVPLHVGSAQHTAALTELFKRLAAHPALLQMVQAGLLRFDLRADPAALQPGSNPPAAVATSAMAATTAIDPAACCSSCRQGKACECEGDRCDSHAHPTAAVPELQGVIGERLIKTLATGVKTVRLHPRAVLTPLGKEALRKRGIAIDRGATP